MGLFNLKKSKNKEDDFEASDAWLMGLAGDDEYDNDGDSSIHAGLASLAPLDDDLDAEERLQAGAVEGHAPQAHGLAPQAHGLAPQAHGLAPQPQSRPTTAQDLLDADDVDLSSWHFPDLAEEPPSSDETMLPPDLGQDPLASGPAGGTTLFDERHTNRASFSPYGDDEEVADAILESADGDHDQPDDGFLVKSGGTAKGFGADLLDGADAATEPVSHASHDLHHLVHDDIEDAIIDDEPHGHTAETIESTAPRGREADLLCEILGVEPGATWAELRAAHAAAMSEYDPRLESDEDRIALAWAIRREMNSTYATLRLLAAA